MRGMGFRPDAAIDEAPAGIPEESDPGGADAPGGLAKAPNPEGPVAGPTLWLARICCKTSGGSPALRTSGGSPASMKRAQMKDPCIGLQSPCWLMPCPTLQATNYADYNLAVGICKVDGQAINRSSPCKLGRAEPGAGPRAACAFTTEENTAVARSSCSNPEGPIGSSAIYRQSLDVSIECRKDRRQLYFAILSKTTRPAPRYERRQVTNDTWSTW